MLAAHGLLIEITAWMFGVKAAKLHCAEKLCDIIQQLRGERCPGTLAFGAGVCRSLLETTDMISLIFL